MLKPVVIRLLLLQLNILLCLGQKPDPAYTTPGPCSVRELLVSPLQLPSETGCGYHCTLDVHVHAPAKDSDTSCPGAPYPIVVFFSGFQLSSSYYTSYAERLASWGFAVVQYDLTLLAIVADQIEVGYLPFLLKHVSSEPNLQGVLDMSQLATAGHSRGAKLAALHLADTPGVVSAFLIDPVDSTSFSPPSPQNPSAADALRGKHKQLAITGAGVSGPCNPPDSNYSVFWEVVGPGSWLELVPQAGHMQFTNISNGFIVRALDLVCHTGKTSHEHVIGLTAPALVAWMNAKFRTNVTAAGAAPMAADMLPGKQRAAAKQQQQQHRRQQRHLLWQVRTTSAKWRNTKEEMLLPSIGVTSDSRLMPVGSLEAFLSWVHKEQLAGEILFEIK